VGSENDKRKRGGRDGREGVIAGWHFPDALRMAWNSLSLLRLPSCRTGGWREDPAVEESENANAF
jgi:hypothetical protein